MAGPLAPPPAPVPTPPVPLPEEVQGDAWTWAALPGGLLQEAGEWPMGFSGLIPLPPDLSSEAPVPGLRLFSRSRALAMAGAKVAVIDAHEDGAITADGIRVNGDTAMFIQHEHSGSRDMTTAIAQAVAALGPVDLLVHLSTPPGDHDSSTSALKRWHRAHATRGTR